MLPATQDREEKAQLVVDVFGMFDGFGDNRAEGLRELPSQPMERDPERALSHPQAGGFRGVRFGLLASERRSKGGEDRLEGAVGVGGRHSRECSLEYGQGPAPFVEILRRHTVSWFEEIPVLTVVELER